MRSPPLNYVSFIVAVVVFAFFASIANAQTLYGITSTGKLVTIKTAGVGAGQAVPVTPGPSVNMQAFGLAFHPDGTLYTWDNLVHAFRTIDPATGQQGSPITVTGIPVLTQGSFSFNSAGTGFFADPFGPRFFSFNFIFNTATVYPVAANFPGKALAFDSSGTKLYAIGAYSGLNIPLSDRDGCVYTVDTVSGTGSLPNDINITTGDFANDGSAWTLLSFDSGNSPWGHANAPVGTIFGLNVGGAPVKATPLSNAVGVPITGIAFAPFVLPPPPTPPPSGGGSGTGGGGGNFGLGGEGTFGFGRRDFHTVALSVPRSNGRIGEFIICNVSHRPAEVDGQSTGEEAIQRSGWTIMTLVVSGLAGLGVFVRKVLFA